MLKSKKAVIKVTALLFTLATVFCAGGLANVNAETTDITEINLTGNYQYGTVPAGVLPEFNPRTTTDSITIGLGNSLWSYYYGRNWRGFGEETPVAYNDGKTKYGYLFQVKPKEGYQLASSNLKVIYNGKDVTSTAEVSRWPWGAYITVDLGKAIGENPTTYKVTFNSNGGTEIPPKEVVSGLKIKAPSTPTKDKYLFKGWYEDSTFSKKFDFNTPITGNITLYAKWEAANSINEVKLAGDYQYGTVPVGTLPSFNPRTMTDSITIDKGNSNWMYKKENGVWRGFGSGTPVAYNDGKTDYGYIFHVAPNDGYQLASSNLKVLYNGKDVTSTAEVSRWPWGAYITVNLGKANGTPVVYTVTFNKNGGSGSMAAVTKNAGETYTLPACTFTAPTGKEFKAWEVNGAQKAVGDSITVNANTTVKAIWKQKPPVTYTVSFDKNGGSGSMANVTKNAGDTYELPACGFNPPTGKEFKAWEVGGVEKAVGDSITVNANTTVKAIWKDKTYNITASVDGGHGTVDPTTATKNKNETVTLTFAPDAGYEIDQVKVNNVVTTVSGNSLTLTMNEDKTVVVKYKATTTPPPTPVTYTLTASVVDGHGSVTPTNATKNKNETVTLTFAPDTGYEIDQVKVNNVVTTVSGNSLTLTMNEDKTVVVKYKATTTPPPTPPTAHSITVIAYSHGSASASKSSANPGDLISISVYPDHGYVVDEIYVKDAANALISRNDYNFYMPNSAVNVYVYFKPYFYDYDYDYYRPYRPHRHTEDKKEDKKSEDKPIDKDTKKPVEKTETEVVLSIGSKDMNNKYNGIASKKGMDVAPYIKNGRTMLPIRYIAEALGMSVDWDAKTRTVIIQDMFYRVEIPVNTNKIIVNGKTYTSDVKPEIKNNRTMLPIANIARALGLKDGEDIIWDNVKKQVVIRRIYSR